jgi:HEAT repeat protein
VLTGFNAGDPVNGLIHDPDSDEMMSGVEESHGLIEDEVAENIPELNNDDPSKRVDAVIRLGRLGEKARGAVPLLRERMGDSVKIIRKNAARSIIRILPPGESFKLLSDALAEKNQEIRSSAVAGLGELNIADRRQIADLIIKSLKDQSPIVRSSAARSIGTFGIDAEHAAPALIKLLFDNESSVRILSVNALERVTWTDIYMQEVINAVKTVSKNDNDKFVKNSAREVLLKLNRRKKAVK